MKDIPMDESRIFATIKRNVLAVVPEIDPNTILMNCSLADLGCNSIDRAEVVSLTMEELRITVPVYEFHQGGTIGEIVALMRRYA